QAIAAVDVASGSFGQAAVAIVHPRLRDELELCSSDGGEAEKEGHDVRNQEGSDQVGGDPAADDALEDSVGRGDQAVGEGDSLGLVGVEDGVIGATLEDGGDFPGEVDGIADAGVHALTADWAV